jgi:hypothetical protein
MCTGTNLTEIAAEQRRRLAGEEGKESGDPGEEAIPKKSRIANGKCGCGQARTVWSTKKVAAACTVCKLAYTEV